MAVQQSEALTGVGRFFILVDSAFVRWMLLTRLWGRQEKEKEYSIV